MEELNRCYRYFGAAVVRDEPAALCVSPRVKIGVSACLLGQEVRFDGGHKRDDFLTGSLVDFLDLVPVCPEVGIGMGVPRPPIRLVGDPERPRSVGVDDATLDVTERLLAFARRRISCLGDISGYILKQNSPSCGMVGVKIYAPEGTIIDRTNIGLFARVLMETKPRLPVVEETWLQDPVLRGDFLTRVLAYHSLNFSEYPDDDLSADDLSTRSLSDETC